MLTFRFAAKDLHPMTQFVMAVAALKCGGSICSPSHMLNHVASAARTPNLPLPTLPA